MQLETIAVSKNDRKAYKDSKGKEYIECGRCRETKLSGCFYKNKMGFRGKQANCKDCWTECNKERNKANGQQKAEQPNDQEEKVRHVVNNEEKLVLNVIYAKTETARITALTALLDYKDWYITCLEELLEQK